MIKAIQTHAESLPSDGSYFIYDLDSLRIHLRNLQNQDAAKLWYACKANPCKEIIKIIQECGFLFDVASNGELENLLKLKIPGRDILLTGPAKSEKLLRQAIKSGLRTFIVESEAQLRILEKLTEEFSVDLQLCLRLQLEWKSAANNSLGGDSITAFGVDLVEAKRLLKISKIPIKGFHVFQWGNILDENQLFGIWDEIAKTCKSLNHPFEILDLGGGLGIPYDLTKKELSWDPTVQLIKELKHKHEIREIWLELGRYAVGSFGCYVTTVIDKKITRGKNILVLEGGFNHLARTALVKEPFPCDLLRKSTAKKSSFQVHGPLCTAIDSFGAYSLPEDIQIGDKLVFSQCGAYGFTESMPYFLCHNLAGEAVIDNRTLRVTREPVPASSWL